jgi:hypothetical protein
MTPEAQRKPISFLGWKGALAVSGGSSARQQRFAREIIAFLHRCKQGLSPASGELAKQYLDALPKQVDSDARDALRRISVSQHGRDVHATRQRRAGVARASARGLDKK